jgi:exodeoxyribonuclease VII large subunit
MEIVDDKKIFSVVEYIELINVFFEHQENVQIQGEVSELKQYPSGHVYFSIRDKSGEGVLSCIIWRHNYGLCGIKLEVGMEIILSGHPNVYAKTGRFSFLADTVELIGEGALQKAYNDLKKKLELEGLFAEEKKRKIPDFIQKIGVITSLEGAVIHDFENNLGKFGFKVLIMNSKVEGQAALGDLYKAIKKMRTQDIEALVIIRGGGSLESLQGFNNETLVREIAKFPVPVIAGIGHDKDVPLLALAADRMVSTPTAAANLLNRSWEEAYSKIRNVNYIFTRIDQEIKRIKEDFNLTWSSIIDSTTERIKTIKERIIITEQAIRQNDPIRQLKLGYSIIRKNNKIIRSIHDVDVGDIVKIQLNDGETRSKISN